MYRLGGTAGKTDLVEPTSQVTPDQVLDSLYLGRDELKLEMFFF